MKTISRREMLKMTGGTATLSLLGMPMSAKGESSQPQDKAKRKVLVIGAHPDDPETGCGGTIILLAKAGYEVVSVYLTRGEAGIEGKTHDEAANIRTEEALNACKIMGVRAEFLTQIDGSCEINTNRYDEMYHFIQKENPDVVITHWPIDSHRDHRICSILVYDTWLRMHRAFSLYYFEVMSGEQSQHFAPTNYVDITSVVEEKHKACFCHTSQGTPELFKESHGPMEQFRGMQGNCKYAEAFIKLDQVPLTF